jgi:uncharacterized iron-regulated membrane protein
MRLILWLHRWAGGIIGLVLALLGLSGAILAFKDWWIMLPGAGDRQEHSRAATDAVVAAQLSADSPPQAIVLASDSFGLHRLYRGEDAGAYVDGTGRIIAEWQSKWERPEVWLFDLHHHLLTSEAGEWVASVAGVIGLGFVLTGIVLWWQTRATFVFRLWPKRMSRSAIIRQHRDLGIVMSPILFLSCLTGSMLLIKPLAALILAPFSPPSAMLAATEPPAVASTARLSPELNWGAILATARARFPGAELRVVSLPRQPGQPISVRLKQAAEWLPNGRSTVWFAPDTGRLIESRDALTLPTGLQWFNMVYPIHAGAVGGLLWKLLIALTGLALTILGSLATWSFWFGTKKNGPHRELEVAAA